MITADTVKKAVENIEKRNAKKYASKWGLSFAFENFPFHFKSFAIGLTIGTAISIFISLVNLASQ